MYKKRSTRSLLGYLVQTEKKHTNIAVSALSYTYLISPSTASQLPWPKSHPGLYREPLAVVDYAA